MEVQQSTIDALAKWYRETGNGRGLLNHLIGPQRTKTILNGSVPLDVVPCRHEGHVIQWCTSDLSHVRDCAVHEQCTRGVNNGKLASCKKCPDYALPDASLLPSLMGWPLAFNERNLWPGLPGKRFNPSIIEHGDGHLFAARTGWKGSEIIIGRMDREFRPVGPPAQLSLWHRDANFGREDPRLFWFRGRVHISYIGVVGGNRIRHTNQLYARLSDDGMQVEQIFHPHYPSRNSWEKNWSFFEHDSQLYASYCVAPHRVLKIDGDRAEAAFETPTNAPWPGGEIRGGAAPVRVGDEYWCFFHDRTDENKRIVYRAGLYTFNVNPPFRLQRIIPEPILTADLSNKPNDQYAYVVWPGGAVLREGIWTIACGIHDRTSALYQFQHTELESRLVRIGYPSWWSHREQWADPGIWRHVVELDEYRLAKLDLTGGVVLDVGAHVGCFAFRAKERGAALVHCYEPWDESAYLLECNAKRMGGVVVYREAIGGAVATRGRFTGLAHAENTGSGNVVVDPGGNIPVTPLDVAIRRAVAVSPNGRIAVLKIDAEGAEGPALEGATLLELCNHICGEWHPPFSGDWITSLLSLAGFTVETVDGEDGRGLFWATAR